MKGKEIIARHNALIKGVIDQVYPPKLNYILSRNMKKMEEEIKNYEEERKKICERLAKKDKNGRPVIKEGKYDLTKENERILNDEVNELLEMDVEINIQSVEIEPILEQCDAVERYHVPTARELLELDFMIR